MKVCNRCVLPSTFPGISFDEDGECSCCKESDRQFEEGIERQFASEDELLRCLKEVRNRKDRYDVLVPLSGGVDSCNALITLVRKCGLNALGFHNDHGFENPVASNNVKRLCDTLDVDLIMVQQDLRFMRKLWKYVIESNSKVSTCYVCGNILYLNAIEVADRYDVPMVINGYSKGQASLVSDKDRGSRILDELVEVFRRTGDDAFFAEFLAKYDVLERKQDYSNKDDLLNLPDSERILIIPFYVFDFYKTDKTALEKRIRKVFDWQPMENSYPSRTTNCDMVWLNSHMDRRKMGFSLYEIEYSEMIRRGDFVRDEAMRDLSFDPPAGLLEKLAGEIGVDLNMEWAHEREEAVMPSIESDVDFAFG